MHEIEEQLCKLDSDKCVVEVRLRALTAPAHRGELTTPFVPLNRTECAS